MLRRWRAVVVAAAFCAALSAEAGPVQEGDTFPDLRKSELQGTLPETEGKVVLIDFFASWCAPCQASFPAMKQLLKRHSARGLVIVAVSVDKKQSDLERFLKKHGCTFAVLRDPAGKLAQEVRPATMPTSYLIDRQGVVRAVHKGFHGEETIKRYELEIEALLH